MMTANAHTISSSETTARNELLSLRVDRVRAEAQDVICLELVCARGGHLPSYSAGAHIDLHLPNGLIRQYSLCNTDCHTERYRIAIARSATSRGGSAHIHDAIRIGAELIVGGPRNNFPLVPNAGRYCFVAGGIGITPILPMIHWCAAAGKPWRLIYCSRTRQRAAFADDVLAIAGGRVDLHFDSEHGGKEANLATTLGVLDAGEHVYCCGPSGLMNAVSQVVPAADQARLHFEWFTATATGAPQADIEFEIVLKQSGRTYKVLPGRSILEVLEENGVAAPYGCRSGFCGCCAMGVLAGEVDHRDNVLSDAARAGNNSIMICVSRARSESLTLDL